MDGLRPPSVGILAMEMYFPNTFVSQSELEVFDNSSKGKYTIGLGQEEMAVFYGWEDVQSFCANAVCSL
jgi:hydroxymethylglutaryl-CoA synthase